LWDDHLGKYYAPKNFNFFYYFGVFSLLVLVNQMVTGIYLAMVYTPTDTEAFRSVEHIMRDVHYGWLVRYMHSTGASAFFIVLYLHMYRGLIYGSYRAPRELLWVIGMAIYLLLLLEAFTGYVLPWGQMSFWGAKVITSLLEAIPVIGPDLTVWFRGDYNITGVTLHRFFALHVILIPFVVVGLVVVHIMALHHVGSNNPDGIEIKEKKDKNGIPLDGIPFAPYYLVKDLAGIVVFLIAFATVIFFSPTMGGLFLEPDNFVEANNLKTPEHIAPVWYMTPYYAILRAIPDKLMGFLAMAGAIAIMFVLPWLDRSKVKSIRYKGPITKIAIALFVVSFISLGYLGLAPVSPMGTFLSRIFSFIYFAFFLLMPFYSKWDSTKPVPERVTG
jgi:ubiquinol-cytochrome c reductase cytochrome b subunit